MNFKLRKVVKNNVVDYGTPDKPKMGFEQKFKMISILKDYEDAFQKKKRKKINTYYNIRSQSTANKYYEQIILKRHTIKRLKTLKQKIGTITQSQRIYVQLPVSVFSLMAFFFLKIVLM